MKFILNMYAHGLIMHVKFHHGEIHYHTGQCKHTRDCYNELVFAFFCTGGGVKGK